jgi:hypothetical protein
VKGVLTLLIWEILCCTRLCICPALRCKRTITKRTYRMTLTKCSACRIGIDLLLGSEATEDRNTNISLIKDSYCRKCGAYSNNLRENRSIVPEILL